MNTPLGVYASANREWELDFAYVAVASIRTIQVLNVIDTDTRKSLAMVEDTSFASLRIMCVLDQIVAEHGKRNLTKGAISTAKDTSDVSLRSNWRFGKTNSDRMSSRKVLRCTVLPLVRHPNSHKEDSCAIVRIKRDQSRSSVADEQYSGGKEPTAKVAPSDSSKI